MIPKRTLLLAVLIVVGTTMGLSAQRVVSLASSLTKNMQYLQAEEMLVGRTSYCTTTRNVPVVASSIKVNIEEVVKLKPDWVLASSLTSPETISLLKKMGLNVLMYPTPKSYEEICNQFMDLAKVIGREDVARKVIKQSNEKLSKLRSEKAKGKRIFIELGAKPLFAVLTNTFMDDYITFLGGTNIAQGLTSGQVTREFVLSKNPHAIFIVTMGVIAYEEKKYWEKYTHMEAIKHKQIFVVDADKACTPTPVTFVETLSAMSDLLK